MCVTFGDRLIAVGNRGLIGVDELLCEMVIRGRGVICVLEGWLVLWIEWEMRGW